MRDATAGTGGTISPAGAATLGRGANQTYTISPSSGRVVADVKVDDVSQGAVTSYTFTNVTADHTIAATFKAKSGGGGGGGGGGGCSLASTPETAAGAAGWAAPYLSLGAIWLWARLRSRGRRS